MPKPPYGNDPAKIARYQDFWSQAEVKRPLVGFTLVGWFPFSEFAACRSWGSTQYLTPEMIDHFQKVQSAHRPLLIRSSLSPDDLTMLLDSLEPRGLFLNIMVNKLEEIDDLRIRLKM